mgnify:CR=1 FL=1
MIKQFSDNAWQDYLHWQQTDRQLLRRVDELIKAIEREPFAGIGKPEPLRHALAGYWSRRINDEHRLVYKVEGKVLMIAAARYHY